MMEFGLSLKKLEGKDQKTCSVYFYYLPYLNEDEACLMAQGHHTYQDGIS